jgi:hypothetical protein
VWSKPVFFAFRILGNEVVSVEFGPSQLPGEEKSKLEGGPGGSVDFGYVMRHEDVVVQDVTDESLSQSRHHGDGRS